MICGGDQDQEQDQVGVTALKKETSAAGPEAVEEDAEYDTQEKEVEQELT